MNKPRRMSAFALACCAGLVLGLAACGESASVPSGSPASSPASAPVSPPPGGRACGTASRPPGRIRHVVWIVMENKSYDEVIGSSRAPYINRLAAECGLATNFQAEAHPSLPNYVAMTSGSTQGITDDADPGAHRLGAPSIFSLLGARWRSLEDSMPANCAGADAELYAVRHNPATYYTGVADSCRARDVPLGAAPDLSAAFTYITPNLCHDMHPCPSTPDSGAQTAAGDSWLAGSCPSSSRAASTAPKRPRSFSPGTRAKETASGSPPSCSLPPRRPERTRAGP